MAVNGLGHQYNYKNVTDYSTSKTKEAAKANESEEVAKAASQSQESASTSEVTAAPKTAESYKPDMDKINAMKADLKNNMTAFKQMVFSQVKDQGNMAGMSGSFNMKELLKNISPEEAQANISEDGYWGVNATATRILDFAKALSGGDPEKIDMLKDAVLKGFGAAEKVWGGSLPGISYQTKEKIMEGFDAWEKEASSAAPATAAPEK